MLNRKPHEAWEFFQKCYPQWKSDTEYHPSALGITPEAATHAEEILSIFWTMRGSNEVDELMKECDGFRKKGGLCTKRIKTQLTISENYY